MEKGRYTHMLFGKELAHDESYIKEYGDYKIVASYSVYEAHIEEMHDKEGKLMTNKDGSPRYRYIDDRDLSTVLEDKEVKEIRPNFYKDVYQVNGDYVEKVEKEDGKRIYFVVDPAKVKTLAKDTRAIIKNGTYRVLEEVGYVLDEDKNTIVMNSDENNWYANIEYMYDPNNVIFNNYDKMEKILNYNGYNVTETRKIVLGANDIYLFDMVINNEKATVFYQRDSHGFTYEITLYTEDINHSEKAVINKIIGILNNAKFDDTIEIDEEAIDLSHSLSEIENN